MNSEVGMRKSELKKKDRLMNLEVGPGVVLLLAELCRGYRCGSLNKKKTEAPNSLLCDLSDLSGEQNET